MRRFFGWWKVRPERWMFALIAALALSKGIFWISLYPMWKIADEPAHFDNIQFRAEHELKTPLDAGRPIDKVMAPGVSKEMTASWRSGQSYFRDSYLPGTSTVPEEQGLEKMAKNRANRLNDGQMAAINYPGVYYTLGTVPYRLLEDRSIVYRVYAVRIVSMLFGVLMVLATFLAARLAFESPELAFTAAALVALQPMFSQQTAAVNNDAAVFGLCALAFYFQTRMLARAPEPQRFVDGAFLGLAVSLAILSKAQGWIMLVTTLLVLGWLVATTGLRAWRAVVTSIASYGGVMYLASLWPVAPAEHPTTKAALATAGVTSTSVDMPYTAASVMSSLAELVAWVDRLDAEYREYLFQSAFGKFSWLEFSLSGQWIDNIYQVWPLISVGVIVAVIIRIARPDLAKWWRPTIVALAGGTALAGVTAILYVEFTLRHNKGVGAIQGRNFLFASPAFAILIVLGLAAVVPKRLRGISMAMTVTAAVCLNVAAVICILRQHYGG